jgi:chorismate mutase/prephenate dehydratase
MKATINQLRKKIDKLDEEIIFNLSKRKSLSMQIGKIKAEMGANILDKKREKRMMAHYVKLAKKYQLQTTFIKQLFKLIIAQSRKLQK